MISTPFVFHINNKKEEAGKGMSGITKGKKLRAAAREKEATVMPTQVLFKNEEHANYLLEDSTHGKFGYSNQYLIIHNGRGMLLNPDGHYDYSSLNEEYLAHVPTHKIEYVFLSHQDPDLLVSTKGWLMITEVQPFLQNSALDFIVHFGVEDMNADRIFSIPKAGMTLRLGGAPLLIIPAHFLHSTINFQIYDPLSKILYSGKLGNSMGNSYTIVENFDDHIQYMLGFHQYFFDSNMNLKLWAKMVRQLDIDMIAPQHGAMIVKKTHVAAFIDWVENLSCGVDLMNQADELPA
jgi:flavorubredoxin